MINKIHLHQYLTLSYAPTAIENEYVLLFESIKNPWKMFSFMKSKELGFATQKQLEQLISNADANMVENLILHLGMGQKTLENGLQTIIGGDFYPKEKLNKLIDKEISLIDFKNSMVAPAKKNLNTSMIFQQIAEHSLACCYLLEDGISIFSPTFKPLFSLPYLKLKPPFFDIKDPIYEHLLSIPSDSKIYLNTQNNLLNDWPIEFSYQPSAYDFAFYLNNVLEPSSLDNAFRLSSEYLLSDSNNINNISRLNSLLTIFHFFLVHEYYQEGHIPFTVVEFYAKYKEFKNTDSFSKDFDNILFNNLLDYYSKDKLNQKLQKTLIIQQTHLNHKNKI